MAGIGEWNCLGASEIKAAFNRARQDGKDFLVRVRYTSQGGLWAPAGIAARHAIEMIDFHEVAIGVGKKTCAEDLREIYKKYGSLDIVSVYRLDQDFDDAVKGNASLLPVNVTALAREVSLEEKQAAYDDGPWYKKLFSFLPGLD